jgi:exopolysaccharide production protein ExoZ
LSKELHPPYPVKTAVTNLNLIQVLRGIASLFVVLFHTTQNANIYLKKDFCFNAFSFGGAGVDIFFVLSGFIITYTSVKNLNNRDKLFPFLRRRFVRIFPAYWMVITGFLLLQFFFASFYSTTYNFTFSNLLGTFFLLPGHAMVNGVSWTLSYELFFYLLFALAFIIPSKKLSLVLAVLYALAIVVLHCLGYNAEQQNNWLLLVTYPMNTEFIMGIIAALVIYKLPAAISLPLIITGTILFLTGAVLFNNGYGFIHNSFNRVIVFGVPSFLIITGVAKFELATTAKVHNVFLKLGEASYSLYLLHLPLVVAAIKIINKLGIQSNAMVHILLFVLVIIICCCSVLFFKFIEKPVINKLNSIGKSVFSQRLIKENS